MCDPEPLPPLEPDEPAPSPPEEEPEEDEEFLKALDDAKTYLASMTGLEFEPTPHHDYRKHYWGSEYTFKFYPIHSIEEISINGEPVEEYFLYPEYGLIYFEGPRGGVLDVKYESCLSEQDMEIYVDPLVERIAAYNTNTDPTRDATTYKEGDVSITRDGDLSEGAVIKSMIDKLCERFNIMVDLI